MPHGIMDFGIYTIPLMILLVIFFPYMKSVTMIEEVAQAYDLVGMSGFSGDVYIYPILIGFICGPMIAAFKNRSIFWWWLPCSLYPPLLIVLACLSKLKIEFVQKTCPHCAESIEEGTKICKHCGLDV